MKRDEERLEEESRRVEDAAADMEEERERLRRLAETLRSEWSELSDVNANQIFKPFRKYFELIEIFNLYSIDY